MKTLRRPLRRIFLLSVSFSLSLNPFVEGGAPSFLSPRSEIKALKAPCVYSLKEFALELRRRNFERIGPLHEKLKKAKKEKVSQLIIELREEYRAYHDLKLDPSITADQILDFIRNNLKKPQILDAEVLFKLFPIMIRWLKQNNWAVAENSYLRKEKIASYLFSSLSKDLKKIEILGEEESEKKENLEKLMFINFFHLFNVQGITYPLNVFSKEIVIKKVSLIGVDLAGIDSTDGNRHMSFLNENFSFADFRGSKLKGLRSCVLIGALLSDTNLDLLQAQNADFSFADLKRASLNGAKLDGSLFTRALLEHADFSPFTEKILVENDDDGDEDFYSFGATAIAPDEGLNFETVIEETSLKGATFFGCDFKTVTGLHKSAVGLFINEKGVGCTAMTKDQMKYFPNVSEEDPFVFIFPVPEPHAIATSL